MENAVDALKIAFAVLVFVIAFTVILTMFTQARETSDVVLQSSDITEYMTYTDQSQILGGITLTGEERIVGLETIIPTLYKYYKENYTVVFLDTDGSPLELYETQTRPAQWSTGYTNRYYTDNDETKICAFDVDDETRRHEPWGGSNQSYKENLDNFLSGVSPTYGVSWNSDGNSAGSVTYDYGRGFIQEYASDQFRESLGEYTYNAITAEDLENEEDADRITNVQGREKRVIVYTLQP